MAYMDYSKIIEKPMKTHNNAMEFEMGNKQPNNSTASFGKGFELDPDYYAKSKQRLEDFMRQPRIDAIEQQQLEQLML